MLLTYELNNFQYEFAGFDLDLINNFLTNELNKWEN
jgi:hypothetical protein